MSLSDDWRTAKNLAQGKLEHIGGPCIEIARRLALLFKGGLGKQLDEFDRATRLHDVAERARVAERTIGEYVRVVTALRNQVPAQWRGAQRVLQDLCDSLGELSKALGTRLRAQTATDKQAEVAFGALGLMWSKAKKSFFATAKAAAGSDARRRAAVKQLEARFDKDLGKSLVAFEKAYPDLDRMKAARSGIPATIVAYRRAIHDSGLDSQGGSALVALLDRLKVSLDSHLAAVERNAADAHLRR